MQQVAPQEACNLPTLRPQVSMQNPGQWLDYVDLPNRPPESGGAEVEIADLDRIIAWGFALASTPDATEPVIDDVVRANGYPLYPVVGYHPAAGSDEAALPQGIAMTLEYGRSGPAAGSCWLQGRFYLRKSAGS
jgi:hypothetical protein